MTKLKLPIIEISQHQLGMNVTDRGVEPPAEEHRFQIPTIPNFPQIKPTSRPQDGTQKMLSLPQIKKSSSIPRHRANPNLAMSLLQEIQATVSRWQTELQQLLRKIQDIYLEGPIIEGWLESGLAPPGAKKNPVDPRQLTTAQMSRYQAESGYRICGFDGDGKFWWCFCPPEELPSVSLAIARYQKLKHLLARKQELETRLTELAETLTFLQGHLQNLP